MNKGYIKFSNIIISVMLAAVMLFSPVVNTYAESSNAEPAAKYISEIKIGTAEYPSLES